jgi:methyl-accepting chemotaxis protein
MKRWNDFLGHFISRRRKMTQIFADNLMKRLITLFLLGALIPIVIISIIIFKFPRKALKEESFNHLSSVREAKAQEILRFLESRISDASFLAESSDAKKAAERLEDYFMDNPFDFETREYKAIYERVDPFFSKYLEIYGYNDVYLISNSNSHVIYTAGKRQDLGTNLKTGPYKDSGLAILFANVLKKRKIDMADFTYYEPAGKTSAFMGAPLFDEEGEIVAVVAFQLGTEGINSIMKENAGIGKTEETYLVGSDLLMRSDSRFERGSTVLKNKIDTAATRDLLAHGEGKKVIKNYKGKKVLSSYSHVGLNQKLGIDFEWGILSEISVAEALAPIKGLGLRILWLSILLAGLACLAGYYAAKSIVMPLREVTNMLATSIGQISSTVSRLVGTSEETNSSVSEITTTVEEVKQTAHISHEKAEQVAEKSGEVAKISEGGKKATEDVSAGMKRIKEEMESIAESIVELSEKTQSIEEIINTVNDLSDQSNLLSINASIEAARAGEFGKSFAIVAQEVKSLANQSTKATDQVKNILNDIQNATSEAVMSTELGSKAVEEGSSLSALAGDVIQKLADSIVGSSQSAMQIAASSKQQLVGTDQLAAAMEIIKEGFVQDMASTKELETATRNLEGLVLQLREIAGSTSEKNHKE